MTMRDADPSDQPKPGSGDLSGSGERSNAGDMSKPRGMAPTGDQSNTGALHESSDRPSDSELPSPGGSPIDSPSQAGGEDYDQRGPIPCHKCGYDITGDDGLTCPECGANIGYRGEAFLKDLLSRTRGGGLRRCNICDEASEFPASGVCPSCGGRSSVPIDTEAPSGGG